MKLNHEAQIQVCAALAAGATMATAAELVGCTPRAVYYASKQDPSFLKKLNDSKARSKQRSRATLSESRKSTQSWREAYHRLQMLYPEKYARAPNTMPIKKHERFIKQFVKDIARTINDDVLMAQIMRRLDKLRQCGVA